MDGLRCLLQVEMEVEEGEDNGGVGFDWERKGVDRVLYFY